MLNNQTMTQLFDMKLHGMATAYEEQRQQSQITEIDFDERFGMLVDRQARWREERALTSRLRSAKFRVPACIEDIDYRVRRGLKRATMDQLRGGDWIGYHQNVILTGPTGTGKTYLACALGNDACRSGYRVRYFVTAKLFRLLSRSSASSATCSRISTILASSSS